MSDSKKQFRMKAVGPKHRPMDKTVAIETWGKIARAIDEVYNHNTSQLSFEELYRSSYNLVLHKHGTLLYEGVSDKLTAHMIRTVDRLADVHDTSLLEEMTRTWSEHKLTLTMVRDILMYLDRTYVDKQKRPTIQELGHHLFRINVWEHPRVQARVTELLMSAIASERAGLRVDDRTLLKSNLAMLIELGRADSSNIYENHFEAIFLGTTQEFYRLESMDFLSKNAATDYVVKATKRLEEEKDRIMAMAAPATTEAPLQRIIETELIERHATTLVNMENSGFAAMLKDDAKLDEMQAMYNLFVRVPSSVDHLREALAERIKLDGSKLISDQEKGIADPPSFVRGVLSMRERYERVVDVSFRGETKSLKRMRESFEDFLNRDARAASCLAVYVDELLRIGLRGATEEQMLQAVQKAIVVFRYLSDKDVFESFYKQHLAKRLLSGKSVSDDAERAMVSQLKAECGYQFTSKLEGMFNDMRISRDMREKYKAHKRPDQLRGAAGSSTKGSRKVVDIEVDVLTNGYWPSQNVPSCTLPQSIQDAIAKFSEYYLNNHTGRKLSWQTSAGAAELKAVFGAAPNFRRNELCVSTYQMCILLLFNDNKTLTLSQIRNSTQIPDAELRRHLISLCTPKHRILRKGSKGRGITSDNDTFTFNQDYTSKLKRVRIPLVKDTTASRSSDGANGSAGGAGSAAAAAANGAVPRVVEEDRRHLVEAAIVRIMKARKSLTHNDLIAEVTRQLSVRFTPSPPFVKKRIESLIEREYIERAENNHRLYKYMA